MAQPEYVPVSDGDRVRVSERLPTPEGWVADRVGELRQQGGQPSGPRLGVAGPDQGYALRLAHHLRDRIVVGPREDVDDAIRPPERRGASGPPAPPADAGAPVFASVSLARSNIPDLLKYRMIVTHGHD